MTNGRVVNYEKLAKYWRKRAQKLWANLKHSEHEEKNQIQYMASRSIRRSRRSRMKGLKNI